VQFRMCGSKQRTYCESNLYWRHLDSFNSKNVGAFLAGTIWIAQCWGIRKDLRRAKTILDAAPTYSNDLGSLAEEADPETGQKLISQEPCSCSPDWGWQRSPQEFFLIPQALADIRV
jgi:hypothetical protein